VRVAFLGPEGTFSEEALFSSAGREGIVPVPLATIYDCVIAVADGRCERALVPIENSLEGSVNATLDALVFETDQVRIVGEVVHPIQHMLIAREQLPFERIDRVVSHPQASAQCARFLRSRLGQAEVIAAASTADAVRIVAETPEPWAALGNSLSAELYGCEVLAERVEDTPENETRFVWLENRNTVTDRAAERRPKPSASDLPASRPKPPDLLADRAPYKTSIVFWGLPDAPGALVGVLQEFATRSVNLTKIESRPRKQGLGRYVFFADLQGREDDEPIVAALAAVRESVETLRVLGCYPAAA
jgi:prephenate dehydratase